MGHFKGNLVVETDVRTQLAVLTICLDTSTAKDPNIWISFDARMRKRFSPLTHLPYCHQYLSVCCGGWLFVEAIKIKPLQALTKSGSQSR